MLKTAELDKSDPFAGREFDVLRAVGMRLMLPVERTAIKLSVAADDDRGGVDRLIDAGKQAKISLRPADLEADDVRGCLDEGYAVVVGGGDKCWVVERFHLGHFEAAAVHEGGRALTLSRGELAAALAAAPPGATLIAKRLSDLESLAAGELGPRGHLSGHAAHVGPLRRFIALLRLDRGDVAMVVLFAFVSGLLTLATPLAVEALVDVVRWGTYLQPLVVIAGLLLAGLLFAGVMRLLQTVVVEVIQRRQMVRMVSDLSYRFSRADRRQFDGVDPRELANRFFDVITIQKSTATLLMDATTIVLTTILGLLLLAFYHPTLMGFSVVLVLCMTGVTLLLGRGGVETAIEESKVKYKLADWLQNVISSPPAFSVNGGGDLAVERAGRLTIEYLDDREGQFRVLFRQIVFAVLLQAVAMTALLGLGGWLVVTGTLTLGQLVASELVVALVIGAFAKAGKSLETFYDLMAGIDKVGHLLDLHAEAGVDHSPPPGGPLAPRWSELGWSAYPGAAVRACELEAGGALAVTGGGPAGSLLLQSLAGMIEPEGGYVDLRIEAFARDGRTVAYASRGSLFHGAVNENVDLGRGWVDRTRVRHCLEQTGALEAVLRLPGGLDAVLLPGGLPLSEADAACVAIAQAIAARPRLLLIDSLLDCLPAERLRNIFDTLLAPDRPWTLLVATNRPEVAAACGRSLPTDSEP